MRKEGDEKVAKKSWLERSTDAIEKVENLLPYSFWLSASLALITVVLSDVLHGMNWSTSHETVMDGATQVTTARITNLMTFKTLTHYLANFISISVNYYPLDMPIFMTVVVGYAERPDLFDALIRKTVVGVPIVIVFTAVSFVDVDSSIGFDVGVVFTMVIAAVVPRSLGLHPWVGVIMGYATTNDGYTVRLMIAVVNTTLAGVPAQIVEANHIVDATGALTSTHAAISYYFVAATTFIITAVHAVVTRYVTAPHLDCQHSELALKKGTSELERVKMASQEARGLRFTGWVTVIYMALLVIACIPENPFICSPDGTLIFNSPFLNMIIPLLFFFFMVIDSAYGIGIGKIEARRDIPLMMEKCLDTVASFMVACLTACTFVNLFLRSGTATVLAAKGAGLLISLNMRNIGLLILVVLLSCFCNLFITSNSGKWVMLTPFLVPVLAVLDINPATTQAPYRIGDSCSSILSPVELNVPIALRLLGSYKVNQRDKVGLGTLISMRVPYMFAYLITFFLLVLVFYFLKLPLGPRVGIFLG